MNPIKNGRITARYDDVRPFSVAKKVKAGKRLTPAEQKKKHYHHAIDIAGAMGAIIRAPATGRAWLWVAFKGIDKGKPKGFKPVPKIDGRYFGFCHYYYNVYGAIIFVEEIENGLVQHTHLIAHCDYEQMAAQSIFSHCHTMAIVVEGQYPVHALYTNKVDVKEGDEIGFVHTRGTSTGPHIHWEIHPGTKREAGKRRIDPEKWMESN